MSKYNKVFTDSTPHTMYWVKITSENDEEITVEADDTDVKEIMEIVT